MSDPIVSLQQLASTAPNAQGVAYDLSALRAMAGKLPGTTVTNKASQQQVGTVTDAMVVVDEQRPEHGVLMVEITFDRGAAPYGLGGGRG